MFKKLRSVIYNVEDLGKAKDWYAKATGLQPYFDEPYYVGFNILGTELGLDPDMKGILPGSGQAAYWAVDDIKDAVHKLEAAGAAIDRPVADVGGGIQVARLRDPFGNIIGLIQES